MKPKLAVFLRYLFLVFAVAIGIQTTMLRMVYAAENKTTITVNVGVVLDLSSWIGKMGLSCIDMSLSDFYASHPNYTTSIVLHVKDSMADVVEAANQVVELIEKNKVEAILGLESLTQAYSFIIKLGEKAEIPIISIATTSSPLSYLRSPYFFQVAQNGSSQAHAISDLIQAFEWRQVVAIYQDDEIGRWILGNLVEAFHDIHIIHQSVIDPAASGDQIEEELYKLKMTQTRVYIVHMMQTLATRLFAKAKEIGMMSEGYVWILTDATANVLNTFNSSILSSMHGVLGVQAYLSRTLELDNFITRWKIKFRQENPTIYDLQLNVYGLWAYDAAWALAMAVERLGAHPDFTSGVSRNGKKISESLSKTKFKGLSGEFDVVKGQLQSPNLQIVNVIGDHTERTVGYWTPEEGLTRDFKQNGLRPIIWPGDSKNIPKGWDISLDGGKKLRIGVPLNSGFSEFATVTSKEGSIAGYCIDIFDAVVANLPYALQYEYVPFVDPYRQASHNDLIYQVYLGVFDAAVGDITISANKSMFVDFTSPYTETGITVVVPIKHDLINHAWLFLKPLTWDLWITSFCFFIFMGFVVWILEHRINKDFHGPPSHQIGTSLWFSFSTMVFAQRETLVSNLTRFVVVIWFLVVFILTQSYTANLTSWLTVQQLQPITDINQILKNDWRVGYQEGSYVFNILQFFGIKNLVSFQSPEELHHLFKIGSCNGGIDVAIDEIPYMKLLLAKFPDDYTMSSSLYMSNGFGFAFPRGSYLVDDMSKAVEMMTQSDSMKKIQERWFGKKINQSCAKSASPSLDLSYFWSLFLIVASAAIFSLILSFIHFLHNEARSLRAIYLDSTIARRIIAAFPMIINGLREGQNDAEPPIELALADAPPSPSNQVH